VKSAAKKTSKRMGGKATTIDEYLRNVTGDKRKALDDLRAMLHALLPKAEECISYGLPAFRLDGNVVAGFAATAKGCSYYPFSGSTLANLAAELDGYAKSSGAVQFTPDKPLPKALVRKLLKARIAEG
jgi:uncharacterized protein YdhG (YjbR/CyaY superfamily)